MERPDEGVLKKGDDMISREKISINLLTALFCVLSLGAIWMLVSACQAQAETDFAVNEQEVAAQEPTTECQVPESDNGLRWARNSCVKVNTAVYEVEVEIVGEIASNSTVNGAGGGSGFAAGGSGFMSSSWRIWQEGKGVLPVRVISITPVFEGVESGMTVLLKTSDLKAMALPVGAMARFKCNQDIEAVSPNENFQVLATERLTYELDDCRMTTPEFALPGR